MPVIMHLVASWDGPSRMNTPEVAQAAAALGLEVTEIDTDQDQTIMQRYGIQSIPAVLLLNGDDLIDLIVGYKPSDQIVAQLLPHVQ